MCKKIKKLFKYIIENALCSSSQLWGGSNHTFHGEIYKGGVAWFINCQIQFNPALKGLHGATHNILLLNQMIELVHKFEEKSA